MGKNIIILKLEIIQKLLWGRYYSSGEDSDLSIPLRVLKCPQSSEGGT